MEKIGKYKITAVLGKGAMGIVYKALDPDISRDVAIKTIRFDLISEESQKEELMRRFIREAQAAGKLVHPNIITVYDVGREKDITYIVMQYVEGQSLQKMMASRKELSLQEISLLMNQLCNALEYAHQRGIVHRDIKPANVLIDKNRIPYVVDFGVARVETSTLTQTGTTVGTPSYMSPEQVMGRKADKRADIFSLGVILYELLTGKRPFEGESITTIIYKIVNENPPSLARVRKDIPSGFEKIINKALAKDLTDRYSSCSQLAQDLRTLIPLDEKTISIGITEKNLIGFQAKRKSKPKLVIAVSLAAVILIGGGGFFLLKSKKKKPYSPPTFERITNEVTRSLPPPRSITAIPVLDEFDKIKEIYEKRDYSEVIQRAEEYLAKNVNNSQVKDLLNLAKERIKEQRQIEQSLNAGIESYNQRDYSQCRSLMEGVLRLDKDNEQAQKYFYLADTAISKKEILQILEHQRKAEEDEDLLALLNDLSSSSFSNQRKEDAVLLFNYYDDIKSLISEVSIKFRDRHHADVKFSHIVTAVYKKTGQKKVVFEGIKTWRFEKEGKAWKIVGP